MDILPDGELALGILANTKFTKHDVIRIVTGLYPFHKRYTFGEKMHTDAWRVLCSHYSPEIVQILCGSSMEPKVSTWGTARCPTHALMCGTDGTNKNWMAVYALTDHGLSEARQHLINANILPTKEQAIARRIELTNTRLAVIAEKNIQVGDAVKSMYRCDVWAAVVQSITDDGFINIVLTTGEPRIVKPTAIQGR